MQPPQGLLHRSRHKSNRTAPQIPPDSLQSSVCVCVCVRVRVCVYKIYVCMNIHVRYVHVVCPAIITSSPIYNFRPRYNTDIKKSTFLNVYVKLGTEQGMTRTYKPEICDVNTLLVFKKKENQKFVLDDFPAVNVVR